MSNVIKMIIRVERRLFVSHFETCLIAGETLLNSPVMYP